MCECLLEILATGKVTRIANYYLFEDQHMQIQDQIRQPDLTLSRATQSQLVKITKAPQQSQLYGAYSDGRVGIFDIRNRKYKQTIHLYQNGQVIDLEVMDGNLVTCTHSQITIYSLEKRKPVSLKGHQSTPFLLTCHPICPLVLSCSNLLILHDLRIQKPINVNFITPPAYSLQYFSDGQFFLLGGQPTRIGNSQWVRTLLNGLAKPSHNGKYILMNQMNGNISLWDWRQSEEIVTYQGIKNQQVYQTPYFGMVDGKTRKMLFYDQDSKLLIFDMLHDRRSEQQLEFIDNSKIFIDKLERDTTQFFRYSHQGLIEKYSLQL